MEEFDCVAVLYFWNGNKEEVPIKRKWVDDIVCAVKGQYTFINNEDNFCIKGQNINHVDIYETK